MDFQENLQKCRDYIKALEDEKRKIEMFRRELPLCLNLVTQAIETYKQQLSVPSNTTTTTTTTTITTEHCLNRSHSDCSEQTTSDDDGGCPVLSEFIPIKRRQLSTSTTETSEAEDEQEEDEDESCDHHESRSLDIDINSDINECKLMMNCDLNDKVCSTSSCSSPDVGEKVDWLRSVQLWNQSSDPSANSITHKEEDLISHRPKKVQVVEVNKGTSAGAFHPFQKEIIAIPTTNKMELCQGNTGVTPTVDMEMACGSGSAANSKKDHDHGLCNKDKDGNGQSRKARRCWSADLHKKFINALQQLGGSHAATPKQIRELMKVDGLTNDEVKSHLQKYRLNCRRPSPAIHNSTSTTHQTPQFVVVGGIWVPSPPTEYATASPTTIAVPTPQSGVHIPVAQKVQQPLHNQATITTGSTQSQSEEMRGNRNNHSHTNNSSSSKGRCSGSGRTSSSFSGLLVSN